MKSPEMQILESSNLAAAGWQDGTLRLQFKKGGVYDYADVPEEDYQALLAAESPGSHFFKMGIKARGVKVVKCDGEHGGPNCGDPECWVDGEPQGA